jgi:hypothetical protein
LARFGGLFLLMDFKMPADTQFRTFGRWALASDPLQWVLQRRNGDQWRHQSHSYGLRRKFSPVYAGPGGGMYGGPGGGLYKGPGGGLYSGPGDRTKLPELKIVKAVA